jgi:TonB family protein
MFAGAFALVILAASGVFGQDQSSPPPHPPEQQSSSPDSSSKGSGDSETSRSIRFGGNVAQANLVYQVPPVYPPIAKTAHISGTVMLHCIIGKDGTVQNLQYISGPPLLMKSAMDAVQQWRYKPMLFNGEPVRVDTTVSVVFTLGGGNAAQSPQQAANQRPQDSKAWPAIVQSAVLIVHPSPIYPAWAIAKHIEGVVVLNATMNADGSVKQLEFDSGPQELKDAAMDAVKNWKYNAIEVDGQKVETQRRIAIVFSLTRNNYKLIASSFDPVSAEVIAPIAEDTPPPEHPAATRKGQTPIPDTLDGIQRQTQEVFDAWQAGDKQKFQELLDGFALEDPAAWFGTTFGKDKSAALVPQYELSLEKFKQHMARVAGYWEKSTTSALHVQTSVTPNPPEEAGQPDGPPAPLKPLNIENFRFYVTTGQVDPGDWVFSFVYMDGAFRIVGGTHTFWNENWSRQQNDALMTRAVTRSLEATPAAPADHSQEPVIYEQVRGKARYENDGTGVREISARMRVQTPAGLTKAGQLVFEYNASNEKIEIRSVKVTKPNGSVITAGPSAVQDLSAPVAREAPMYTDARQKHVTVPGLAVGDIVEYDVVITIEPLLPGQFWQTWNFISNAVSLDEQFELDVPHDRLLKIKASPGVDSSVRDEGDRRIYHWSTSTLQYSVQADLAKKFNFDVRALLQGPLPPPGRTIMFSTFQSWGEVGTWYSNLERERRIPTAAVRAQADEIVRGQSTEFDKARALYGWVSQNIRYVSLSFGVGRYQPHAAEEVLQNRYGDCKDKTTLLEAMFEAEGLHGLPVLINSKAEIDPDVPTPLQFDHAFTFVSFDGHDYWLDPTPGVSPFGYLLPQLRGKNALVASAGSKSELQTTPRDLPYASLYHFDVNGSVDENKNVDLKLGADMRGDLEVLLRMGFREMSPEQLTAVLQGMQKGAAAASNGSNNITFSDLKGSDPSDTRTPFHLEIRIQGNTGNIKQGSEEARRASRTQSMQQLRAFFSYLLPPLGTKADGNGHAEPQAAKPEEGREFSVNLVFTSPEIKKQAVDKPIHIDISKDFAQFKVDIAREGQTVRGTVLLNLRRHAVPAGEADDYAAFVEAVSNSLTSMSAKSDGTAATKPDSLVSSGATPAGPPKDSDAGSPKVTADPVMPLGRKNAEGVHELFERGKEESKQQNYANAVESFTEAVNLDPEDGDAWRELGRAQMYLRNFADAEADFRKYLALAPEDRLAYMNMAWALSSEKKYTETVVLLTKRIADAPNDGDANTRLGVAYLALHQPELALPVLKKGASIYPRYEYAQYNLARAYLQLHQEDSAAVEFQRAIKLDDTSNTRNSAAYLLAEANTHLEIATAWSDRAIEAVGLELNQTKFPLQAASMRRVSSLAAYWDTMGWIKFQQGNLEAAEKYVRAGTELADDSTIVYHLGRINEAQGRKDEAIEAYAETLASVPTTREVDDDEIEARTRLGALLGDDSLVDDRVKQSRPKLKERRSVSIANPAGLEGIAQYTVIIGLGPKVIDLEAMNPDDSLAGLKDAISAATLPQSFPDETIQRIPRVGTLSCPQANLPCTFTLASAGVAARVVTAD